MNVYDIRIEKLTAREDHGVLARCYIGDNKIRTIGIWTYNPIDLDVTDFEGVSLREHYTQDVRNLLARGEQLQLIEDVPNDFRVHRRPTW